MGISLYKKPWKILRNMNAYWKKRRKLSKKRQKRLRKRRRPQRRDRFLASRVGMTFVRNTWSETRRVPMRTHMVRPTIHVKKYTLLEPSAILKMLNGTPGAIKTMYIKLSC